MRRPLSRMPSRRLIIGACLLIVVIVILQSTVRISVQDIENTVAEAGVFGPIAYAIVLFLGISVPFNPVSDVATVNVAALVFTPETSVAATFAAHSVALIVNFAIAKRYGHAGIRLLTGRNEVAIVNRLSDKMGYRTVFLTRFMLPITAIGIDVVSYLAGIKQLRFVPFYIASIVPWTLISIVYFYSTSHLKERSLVLFFIPAALLILGPPTILFLWRRFRARQQSSA